MIGATSIQLTGTQIVLDSDQIETTIKTDYAYWLIENESGRWVFYVKATDNTYLKDTNYLTDSNLPVKSTTTYSTLTYYDYNAGRFRLPRPK